jgi:hypothetical protein
MMDMMGLHDPDREIDDELSYLQCFPVHPDMVNNIAPSELVDIVPMAGVIQAGQSQRFTIIFYGKSDISFKTVICCYIEGGASKYITVIGHSTPPPTQDHAVTSTETKVNCNYSKNISPFKIWCLKPFVIFTVQDSECKPKSMVTPLDLQALSTCIPRGKNIYKFTTHVRKSVTRVVPVTNK